MIRTVLLIALALNAQHLAAQQPSPLDSARQEMNQMKRALKPLLASYRQTYAGDSLKLKNLTVYDYNAKGELLLEKSYSDDYCHLHRYQGKQVVSAIADLNESLSLDLKRYDEHGVLVAKRSYNDYFKNSVESEVYSTEERQHQSKDSLTVISLVNKRATERHLYVYRQGKLVKMLMYKPVRDTVPDTEFIFDEPEKDVRRTVTHMRRLDYHQETVTRYLPNGDVASYLSKDLESGKVKETRNYYEQNLLRRSDELVNGELDFWRIHTYDKAGRMLSETGYGVKDGIRYRSLYEYDAQGRKKRSLYFFAY